ncbi:hypothetical protein I656_03141 [Geobacillus sp. WSUCF1]|nr:hypothetical protein I656_03141 [Geobacillus sp. WSUCF1]
MFHHHATESSFIIFTIISLEQAVENSHLFF